DHDGRRAQSSWRFDHHDSRVQELSTFANVKASSHHRTGHLHTKFPDETGPFRKFATKFAIVRTPKSWPQPGARLNSRKGRRADSRLAGRLIAARSASFSNADRAWVLLWTRVHKRGTNDVQSLRAGGYGARLSC